MEGSCDGIQWELVGREVLVLLGLRIDLPLRIRGFKIGEAGNLSLEFGNCSYYCVFGYFFFRFIISFK